MAVRLRAANPDLFREADRRHRAKDIEKSRAKDRAQWHKLDSVEKYERRRKRSLMAYGLTVAQHAALLESQGCRCAVCGNPDPGAKGWCIDHDHEIGKTAVRGLVCLICNVVLGMMGDSLAGVRRYGWTLGVSYFEITVPLTQRRLAVIRSRDVESVMTSDRQVC
jgi:hypothetical protein